MKRIFLGIFGSVFVFLCLFQARAFAVTAKAEIFDANGKKNGTVRLKEIADGVRVKIRMRDITPGQHGIHIHAVGKCEGPDFASAGGHFNPANKKHGLKNSEGSHAGDLPNLEADAQGLAKASFIAKGATLKEGGPGSLLKTDGTAIVIHAGPDDEQTDPSGNSGGRIACGVIEKV